MALWARGRDAAMRLDASYILPIRRERVEADDLGQYLRELARTVEVIVVDGSPPAVFSEHEREWGALVVHIPPDPDLATEMGKVGGVLTGIRRAQHERVVIADDDVRYEPRQLMRIVNELEHASVVRPQNYFDPLPWHARWDTARTLLNRMTGGDWPGTLAVRRSMLEATGGYDGSVMFENLELVRTVQAAGGTESVPLDLFVRRAPPVASHFWSQRVRQAYDELARPVRMLTWLAVLPLTLALAMMGRWRALAALWLSSIGIAELGRWRSGGRSVFPFTASLLAPAWIAERGLCAWLAVLSRVLFGGVRYRGKVLKKAATPIGMLRRRHARARWRLQANESMEKEPSHPMTISTSQAELTASDVGLDKPPSCCVTVDDGQLVRVDNPAEPPPALAELVHDQFRALVMGPRFSCLGAKSALTAGHYWLGLYGEMGEPETARALARNLATFVEREEAGPAFRSFIAVFAGPTAASEDEFEQLLWQQLRALHEEDRMEHDWDPSVSSDPENPHFSFSVGGQAFFVVGLHAASSRWARRFAWPTLVFNPHDQFEKLREDGKFGGLQERIRAREQDLQGSVNANLSNYGERSEARQYSGRPVGDEWRCPFDPAHADDDEAAAVARKEHGHDE